MGKLTQLLFWLKYRMMGKRKPCAHQSMIREVSPTAQGCEDCLKIGDSWVHLRICKICGHVGCCDNSKKRHATRHFHETGRGLDVVFCG